MGREPLWPYIGRIMTEPTRPDYRQHLEVETPEMVVLDYEIAGLGSRALAAILDTLILIGWTIALFVLLAWLVPGNGVVMAFAVVLYFATLWGYFAFFEGLRGGQTPGKRRVGIRVVRDTGHAVTLGAAAIRNLLRLADFLPPPYLLGALFVALHPRGKRLGDIVAGTMVVRDRPHPAASTAAASQAEEPEAESAGVPQLSDAEFRVIHEFAERAPALPEAVRARVAAGLAPRFAERFPRAAPDAATFLSELYQDELSRRRGRFGGRGTQTEGARRGSGGIERLVARQTARWTAFEKLADRAARSGLDSFSAAELPDFAARYREVAADLARARTYGASQPLRARLERLVAAGHNALYRDDRKSGQWLWTFLLEECPAGIVAARQTVLIAFLTFAIPAAAGFLLLRERPALAEELLPAVMLERAEVGLERQQAGRGYYEADVEARPLMASTIMTNNIGVAFNCFASGIFAGVGSLVLLGYNGLAIGAVSSHFANLGLFGYLWTFIIGHGVLELFAIWVAGAAGFLLGKALLAPGDLPRGEALVLAGRLAARMIGAVIVLLVLAGLIEGFVSASEMPLGYRLAVSMASLVFLGLYLMNGARTLRRQGGEPAAAAGSPAAHGGAVRPAS